MLLFPQNRKVRGVTVMETLVAAVLLGILAALLLPLLGQMRERSRETRCLHNLRTVGGLLTTAILEKGGALDAWYSGSTGGEFWNTLLIRDRYLTADTLEKLACPSIPYADADGSYNGRHYGIYMPDTTNNLIDYRNEAGALQGRAYRVDLKRIALPAGTIFLGDSVTSAGSPTVRIFRTDSASFASGAFHARHQGRVNLFFYDGHAESAAPLRLRELGVRRVYDKRLQPLDIKS